jgi:anti-sigma regulatory factor (Ser/Thr protein kinase)
MNGQGKAEVSSRAAKVRLELEARPQSAADARRAVASLLGASDLDELVDTAVLLTSEVVTNAILHARSNVVVIIVVTPPIVRVEVSDDAERYPEMRRADEEATSGRGMTLVDALASAWGVQPANGGKCVWFEVAA